MDSVFCRFEYVVMTGKAEGTMQTWRKTSPSLTGRESWQRPLSNITGDMHKALGPFFEG